MIWNIKEGTYCSVNDNQTSMGSAAKGYFLAQ